MNKKWVTGFIIAVMLLGIAGITGKTDVDVFSPIDVVQTFVKYSVKFIIHHGISSRRQPVSNQQLAQFFYGCPLHFTHGSIPLF